MAVQKRNFFKFFYPISPICANFSQMVNKGKYSKKTEGIPLKIIWNSRMYILKTEKEKNIGIRW
ncbi:MAG: hypothetical protein D8M50_09625 [Candidatus Brocadia sp. AMX1]|nr:hypothetical protein [Candidatus Brocadia sp. AMX1]